MTPPENRAFTDASLKRLKMLLKDLDSYKFEFGPEDIKALIRRMEAGDSLALAVRAYHNSGTEFQQAKAYDEMMSRYRAWRRSKGEGR